MRHCQPLLAALLAVALAGCDVPGDSDPDEIEPQVTAGTSGDAGDDDATAGDAASLPVVQPPIPDEPPPRRMPGAGEPMMRSCDAEAARDAIGKVATAEVVEQARRAAGAEVVRTLEPGQMVTMEYHPGRLNIDVDEQNVILDVRCG